MTFLRFLAANSNWIGAGFLMTFLSSFGQTFFISVFSGDIRAAFDLTHAQWGSVYAIGTFSSAIVMLWSGGLSDRFRTRNLGVIVFIGLALSCVAMAVNPWAWALVFIIFALRLSGQGMATHLAAVAMSRWFVAQRGRALSFSNLGYSLGEAGLPILIVALMGIYDWRLIWVGCAGFVVLMIPIFTRLLRNERHPRSSADQTQSTGMQGQHWSRWKMLRHPLFWFMLPTIIGPGAFVTAFFFQQVPYVAELGMDHIELVRLFPLFTGVAFGTNLIYGWAVDRWGVARILPFYLLPMVGAFVLFANASSLASCAIGFVLLGISVGGNGILPTAFWAEFYGTRHLGGIKSVATAVMVLGSAMGPAITGVLLTAGITLHAQYNGVAVYFAVASVLMALGVRKYRVTVP